MLSAIEYGHYISIVKFIFFALLFFGWLPLLGWVYRDAQNVRARYMLWTAIIFGSGAAALILWLLIPIFTIGFLLFLISVGGPAAAYVMNRNTRVPEFERILTPEHIRGIISKEKKHIAEVGKGMTLITANNNDVVAPEPKTPDFFGYMATMEIFSDAIWRRASDIAMLPAAGSYNLFYNIDGVVSKQPARKKEELEYLIYFVKNLSDLDPREKRKPQRGRFKIRKDQAVYVWEVNSAGSTAGEQVQIKHIRQDQLMQLEDLGLNAEQLGEFKTMKKVDKGVFLISGPRRSGITTTMYAMLANHDPFLSNVVTLERRIAYDVANVSQNLYSLSDTGMMNFTQKLESILRGNPDVVGVGDCDDSRTALLISKAAKEGHIFYVTLEISGVVQTLGKWITLVQDKDLSADTVVGISSQHLLRKLCEKCKEAYEPNPELLKKLNIPAEKAKTLYRNGEPKTDKKGKVTVCEHCQGTGFFGRTAIFETIMIDETLRNAIKQSKTLQDIATHFRRARMLFMQEQAIQKVIEGITSINEVIREFTPVQKPPQKA